MLEALFNSTGPFVITFREALEAALIVGVIAAYLRKIGRADTLRFLWIGILFAVLASLGLGLGIAFVSGGLSGASEKLFEGGASITATMVLTYMIIWMARNARKIKGELERKVDLSLSRGQVLGIAALAFVAVGREGLETVLFLTALALQDPSATFMGAILGVGVVSGLSLLMMRGVYRLDVKKFFKYTSIILIIFAAGIFGYGVHELIEAGGEMGVELGILAQPAYNINPGDSQAILHEKGAIGSIFKALVGYDGNPEWLRVAVHFGYLSIAALFLRRAYAAPKIPAIGIKRERLPDLGHPDTMR